MNEEELNKITEKIIGCAYTVSNILGSGFLEKVYENGLAHELGKSRYKVEQQKEIDVIYDGVVVGKYIPDLTIEECVIVEIKTVKGLDEKHSAQCLNYLHATSLPVCLIINFAKPKIELKRFYLSNNLRDFLK
jgi:GxxExxY protein